MMLISKDELVEKQRLFRELFKDAKELPCGGIVTTEFTDKESLMSMDFRLSSLGELTCFRSKKSYMTPEFLDEIRVWESDNFKYNDELIDIILIGKPYAWLRDFHNLKKLSHLRFFDSAEEFINLFNLNVEYVSVLDEFIKHTSLLDILFNHPNKNRFVIELETFKRKGVLPDVAQYYLLKRMLGEPTFVAPPLNTDKLKQEVARLYMVVENNHYTKKYPPVKDEVK
jgi:hypothetical protein